MKNLFISPLFLITFIFFLSIYSCTKEEDKVYPTSATPLNFLPANNDTGILLQPILTWSACTYPDAGSVSYDIYLGTTNPPDLLAADIQLTQYPVFLKPYQKYYWKVVAKDSKNNETSSSVWSFTTGNGFGTSPGDLAIVVTDTQTTPWGGAEVFLYLTETDRTNDPIRNYYWRKATTDNSNPANIGAIFYALSYQKYYVFARHDLGGGHFITGVGESFVPAGKKTKLIVIVK